MKIRICFGISEQKHRCKFTIHIKDSSAQTGTDDCMFAQNLFYSDSDPEQPGRASAFINTV